MQTNLYLCGITFRPQAEGGECRSPAPHTKAGPERPARTWAQTQGLPIASPRGRRQLLLLLAARGARAGRVRERGAAGGTEELLGAGRGRRDEADGPPPPPPAVGSGAAAHAGGRHLG